MSGLIRKDPEYAIKQGLSLDWGYYLEHTIKNPLSRILEYAPISSCYADI